MVYKFAQVLLKLSARNICAVRYCSTLVKQTDNVKIYEVVPRCTLNGFISYKTILTPHDVNNTAETDKLIVKCDKPISVNQIGNALNLTTTRDYDENIVCEVSVPLKANINLTSLGDIKIGDLQGDFVRVFSDMGSVTFGNLKCSEIQAGTNDHNINIEGNLEASRIDFLCRRKGSINAQKIKCLGLKLDTNEGEINVRACYSRNGYFLTRTGAVNLKNIHNRCRIEALKQSNVRLVGFEGALEVSLQNGKADLQVQKLLDDSDILVREEGDITLRIPKELLDSVDILVWSKGCFVEDGIPHVEDEVKDLTTIHKEGVTPEHTLRIRCAKATCNIRLASWVDMVEKQIADQKSAVAAS